LLCWRELKMWAQIRQISGIITNLKGSQFEGQEENNVKNLEIFN